MTLKSYSRSSEPPLSGKISSFLSLSANILTMVADTAKATIND